MEQFKTDKQKSRAFTLIEVLVTLFILSTGLLALASLQIKSIQTTHNAYLLTQATLLAHDIAERMRSNPGFDYGNLTTPSSKPDCITKTCTPPEIAEYDYYEWQQNLKSLLPKGSGTIKHSISGNIVIEIHWYNGHTTRPTYYRREVKL